MSRDRLCPSLRAARERLCIAQTDAEWPGHRHRLQEALDIIDEVGVFVCPDWSRFDVPTTELDKA